jgi:two-component system, OmpR family, phosphate regulon response regulator PhoB
MARVLVVDHEVDRRHTLRQGLERAGHQVVALDQSKDVLRAATAMAPDLVLLEADLPDAGCAAVCRELKARPQTASIPVIMVTGSQREQARIEAFEAGTDDCVLKPFSLRELLLRMRAVIRPVPLAAPKS